MLSSSTGSNGGPIRRAGSYEQNSPNQSLNARKQASRRSRSLMLYTFAATPKYKTEASHASFLMSSRCCFGSQEPRAISSNFSPVAMYCSGALTTPFAKVAEARPKLVTLGSSGNFHPSPPSGVATTRGASSLNLTGTRSTQVPGGSLTWESAEISSYFIWVFLEVRQ